MSGTESTITAPNWQRWLRPSYVWRRLRHNILPKLLALAAACVLWYTTTSDRRANVEQGFDVPITVRDTTGGNERRAVSNLNPDTLRVTLTGRPERLRELRGANIEAVVDVTGLPEGGFSRVVSVTVPTGTTLTRKSPERVQGFVDTQLSRTVPVTVSVETPPEDTLPRYSVSPAQVTASGPSRVVATLGRVLLVPTTLGAGEEREVRLLPLDTQGNPLEGVRLSPSSVTLSRIDRGHVPVKSLPVVLNDPPAALKVTSLSVQPGTVRVVADPSLLGRLREIPGRVSYHPGTYTAPVNLILPAGTQALDTINVRLTVERARP